MKVIVEVCEICRKEDCDGKTYQTEYMYSTYGLNVGVKVVCKNGPSVGLHNGKLMYLLVSGHGNFMYYDLEEVKK